MTESQQQEYINQVAAKSAIWFSSQNYRAQRRSIEASFLRPQFMAGIVWGASARRSSVLSANPTNACHHWISSQQWQFSNLPEDSHMTKLIPFDFNSHAVRTLNKSDSAWFVAKDICEALDYSHVPSAMRSLDDDEKGVHIAHTLGGDQKMTVISESGLFHLILKSRKPEAKAFRKWVTSEVLPNIRKTGGYKVIPDITRFLVTYDENGTRRIQDVTHKTLADTDKLETLSRNLRTVQSQINYFKFGDNPDIFETELESLKGPED